MKVSVRRNRRANEISHYLGAREVRASELGNPGAGYLVEGDVLPEGQLREERNLGLHVVPLHVRSGIS